MNRYCFVEYLDLHSLETFPSLSGISWLASGYKVVSYPGPIIDGSDLNFNVHRTDPKKLGLGTRLKP